MAHRRVGWTTDVHLNFVNLPQWDAFVSSIERANLDALLLTGDISEAEDVVWQLERLAAHLPCAVYFVLGNHDFYRGSIQKVRDVVHETARTNRKLFYLTGAAAQPIHAEWAICGDDGWADAKVGNYFRSPIRMNDFRLISEIIPLDSVARYRFLRRQGAASAVRLASQLRQAATLARRILVLTHIPPFREACWYEHQHSNDDWAPFFICRSVGWVLERFCRAHPEHEVLVLCGHTHHAGRSKMAPNLSVWTGRATYGTPELIATIDFDNFSYPVYDWEFDRRSPEPQ